MASRRWNGYGYGLGGQWIGVGLAVRREARKSCQEAAALQGKDDSGLHFSDNESGKKMNSR